jgi:hypothetical protein
MLPPARNCSSSGGYGNHALASLPFQAVFLQRHSLPSNYPQKIKPPDVPAA